MDNLSIYPGIRWNSTHRHDIAAADAVADVDDAVDEDEDDEDDGDDGNADGDELDAHAQPDACPAGLVLKTDPLDAILWKEEKRKVY